MGSSGVYTLYGLKARIPMLLKAILMPNDLKETQDMPKGKKEKAANHKHHVKLQRDKELKRKERRNVQLPAEYYKGKK